MSETLIGMLTVRLPLIAWPADGGGLLQGWAAVPIDSSMWDSTPRSDSAPRPRAKGQFNFRTMTRFRQNDSKPFYYMYDSLVLLPESGP